MTTNNQLEYSETIFFRDEIYQDIVIHITVDKYTNFVKYIIYFIDLSNHNRILYSEISFILDDESLSDFKSIYIAIINGFKNIKSVDNNYFVKIKYKPSEYSLYFELLDNECDEKLHSEKSIIFTYNKDKSNSNISSIINKILLSNKLIL